MRKLVVLVGFMGLLVQVADAQFRRGRPSTPPAQNNQPGTTVPPRTGNQQQRTQGNQPKTPAVEVQPKTTMAKDESPMSGLLSSPSLRNNSALERSLVKDREPLEYEYLREDDAIFSHYVWREINTKEKLNKTFDYQGMEESGKQGLIYIILNAIKMDSVVAFNSDGDQGDTRFSTPYSLTDLEQKMKGNLTYRLVPSLEDENVLDTTYYYNTDLAPSLDSIYTFRLKEQWIFDKESSRMFVRIIGIAPVANVKNIGGGGTSSQTLFWVYYPDLRKTLAKTEVYNGKNMAQRMTWEDLFEARMFSSYIVKSTIDNPNDLLLKNMPGLQGNDRKLFQLYEGENIKEKIFNYEQSLWAY